MKVLLCRPPSPNFMSANNVICSEPLELEYLYTVLKNKHKVYIYDAVIEKRLIKTVLKSFKPDIIAISGYIVQEEIMKKLCKKAKKINSDIITVLGGVHAQKNYQRLYDKYVDFIFRSEDIREFAKFIDNIEKKVCNFSDINGLCYKSEDKFISNELFPTDITKFPIPDRSFFNKHKRYYNYLELNEVATVKSSLSCPFNCSFCYCTVLNCGKYVSRSIDYLIDEIKSIQADNIIIVDDDFLVDREKVIDFIKKIRQHNIKKKFVCYSRADFIAKNQDIIRCLIEIGVVYFLVGIESNSDKELNDYNKKTDKNENEKAIEIIQKNKGDIIALMIANIDYERKDFENIYKFVKKNKLKTVTVSIFTPIHGTKLYEKYKDEIITDDVRKWDFLHLVLNPTKLSKTMFYYYFYKLNIKIYNHGKKLGAYKYISLRKNIKMLVRYIRDRINMIL